MVSKIHPATHDWPHPGGFVAVSPGLSQQLPSMLAPCFSLLTSPVTLSPFNPFVCKMTDKILFLPHQILKQLPARPLTFAREFFKRLDFPLQDLLRQLLRIYTGIYYYFKIIIIIIIIIVITITTIIILLITITILLLIIIITTIIIIMTNTIIVTIIHDSGRQHFMMDGTQALEPDRSGLGSQFHRLLVV